MPGSPSNYPPGVTGNEPQIAGTQSLGLMRMTCEGDALFVSAHVVQQLIHQVAARLNRMFDGGVVSPESFTEFTDRWMTDAEGHTIEVPCEWEGDVDVEFQGRVAFWTCPRCGTDHEDDQLWDDMKEDAQLERHERERDL